MPEPKLHIVLYEPLIPHNTGSVGRTCVALGAKLWLVRPLGFRLDDRYLRRAGLDYWEHLDWEVVDNWDALLERLPDRQPWLFSKKALRSFDEPQFASEEVLVFGAESYGLPQTLLDAYPNHCLRIPIQPAVRSLNLSVSVAVAAFEVKRQDKHR